MTKRIIAILMSLLMVFSALFLSACDKDKDKDKDGDGASSINVEEASARELFKYSFMNTSSKVEGNIPSNMMSGDLKVSGELKINKLEVGGEDMTMGKPIAVGFNAAVDSDNNAIEANASLELLGEKPSIGAVITAEAVYITDFLGVNDKAIAISLEEVMGQFEAAMNAAEAAPTQDMTELYNKIIDIVEKALEKNVTDDAFAKEIKDVTIDGTEFKGAAVVTFTINKDMIRSIASEIITGIMDSDEFKAALGEELGGEITQEDLNELESELDKMLEDFESIVVTNTLSKDAETVAMDMVVKGDLDGYDGFALRSSFVGSNCKVSVGPIFENGEFNTGEGVLRIDYTLDGAGNEKFVVAVDFDGESLEFVKAEGTYVGNKREGTLTISADGQGFSLKYAMEGNFNNGKFSVKDLTITAEGETMEIPVEVTVEYSMNDTKADMKVSVKADIEGLAKIDVSAQMAVETSNVTINVPANSINAEDISEDEMMNWMSDIMEKYPNIFNLLLGDNGLLEGGLDF